MIFQRILQTSFHLRQGFYERERGHFLDQNLKKQLFGFMIFLQNFAFKNYNYRKKCSVKKFLLAAIFCVIFAATPDPKICPKIEDFSPMQNEILLSSYDFGRAHNLGFVLAAIAWQESCAGLFSVNFSDPSAGVFHIFIPNALRHENMPDTPLNRNIMGQILINDFALSKKLALNELLLWQAQHVGDEKKIIKSYNKGNSWRRDEFKNAAAENYYHEVEKKMKILREILPKLQKNTKNFVAPEQKMPPDPKKSPKFVFLNE